MPDEGVTGWEDAVKGWIEFPNEKLEDLVLVRSDGRPTYNFASPLEDWLDEITHVIRGDDHVSNTPKQIQVLRALGAEPPVYAHVPNVFGTDGKKLSKRHGATAVSDYDAIGILPAAMRNFLALLGWNPGNDRELYFAMDELVSVFSLERIQKTSAVFDMTKLEWMNGQYLNAAPLDDLVPILAPHLERLGVDPANHPRDRLLACIASIRGRSRTTIELAQRVAVRLDRRHIARDDAKAQQTIAKDPAAFRQALRAAHAHLVKLAPNQWEPASLEAELRALAGEVGVGVGAVMQPIRIAITGYAVSEPVNELLVAVGRDESLARLVAAQEWEPRAASREP
jgi:glutamyl-tRNA synthetase